MVRKLSVVVMLFLVAFACAVSSGVNGAEKVQNGSIKSVESEEGGVFTGESECRPQKNDFESSVGSVNLDECRELLNALRAVLDNVQVPGDESVQKSSE